MWNQRGLNNTWGEKVPLKLNTEHPKIQYNVDFSGNLYISEGGNIRRATPEELKVYNDEWSAADTAMRMSIGVPLGYH